jgi:hypothetical protein
LLIEYQKWHNQIAVKRKVWQIIKTHEVNNRTKAIKTFNHSNPSIKFSSKHFINLPYSISMISIHQRTQNLKLFPTQSRLNHFRSRLTSLRRKIIQLQKNVECRVCTSLSAMQNKFEVHLTTIQELQCVLDRVVFMKSNTLLPSARGVWRFKICRDAHN